MTADLRGARYCSCSARLAHDNRGVQCGRCQRRTADLTHGAPAVPSGFWTSSDQLRDALSAWHMGQVIAAYRAHPAHRGGLSQETVAGWMGLTQAQLSRIESGGPITDLTKLIRWAQVLDIPPELLWFKLPTSRPNAEGSTDRVGLERLRREATNTLGSGAAGDGSLDDWDRAVVAYGRATRYEPAGALLQDLAADFAELQASARRRQAPRVARRLTRVTAQLAGLISQTLLKLGDRGPARAWGRTARVAADQAGDPALVAWVRAQDAYTFFYAGNLREAVAVAREAQAIGGRRACVGTVLAAALEARAQAMLGLAAETKLAASRADGVLAALPPDDVVASAFGYNEAQLRFHQGNALTHLGESKQAQEVQLRALALYPATDYLDRALIELDRARCLVHDGELAAGADLATSTLTGLSADRRDPLIVGRARDLVSAVAPADQAVPAVRGLRNALALPFAGDRS